MTIMLGLQLTGGLLLLWAGGELVVRGSVSLAQRFGVSRLVIGLTLVGFGTSLPELVATVQAVLTGAPGVAVGNIVGSNIANILFILGLSAAIAPIVCEPRAFYRDGTVLALTTLVVVAIAVIGHVGRAAGLLLVCLLACYTAFTYWKERIRPDPALEIYRQEVAIVAMAPPMAIWLSAAITVAGFGLTLLGARWMVEGSVELARLAGISEAIIGLTIVAIGTSLPELATSMMAARKGEGDVAFGNIIGSCIFNGLGILGVTALVRPLDIPAEIVHFDVWAMLAVVAMAIGVTVTGWRINRFEGGLLLTFYVAYLAAQAVKVM